MRIAHSPTNLFFHQKSHYQRCGFHTVERNTSIIKSRSISSANSTQWNETRLLSKIARLAVRTAHSGTDRFRLKVARSISHWSITGVQVSSVAPNSCSNYRSPVLALRPYSGSLCVSTLSDVCRFDKVVKNKTSDKLRTSSFFEDGWKLSLKCALVRNIIMLITTKLLLTLSYTIDTWRLSTCAIYFIISDFLYILS